MTMPDGSVQVRVNGRLGKIITAVATTVISALILSGAGGLWVAARLAWSYEEHQKDYEITRARVDKLWDEGVRNESNRQELQDAKRERRELEKKLDLLLLNRGIDPSEANR